MIAVTAPSPSPPASQTHTALSQPIATTTTTKDTNDEDQGVSLSRNTSVISTNSSSSSSSSLEPPPRPRPIRTYTGPQAKNVPDVLPASPTTPKATQRNFDDYMMGATMGVGGVVGAGGGLRRAGTPPGAGGANIAAQMAQAIAYSGSGLMVPGGGSTSGNATPIRGSPTPGTSTPNGARSRQASSSNTPQNYQFQDFLGEGSYSSVYTAVSLVNQQVYAIKVIQKRLLQKENKVRYATSERAILSKLGAAGHPGIIKLYSAFQDLNSLYFAFELAPNGDLFKQIRQLGSFDITGTRYYAATILDAVAFIHSMNIIHRDLKPENILLDAHMRPKISDFGSAKDKSIAVITTGDARSLKGSFVGTPEYASPEMLVPPTITTRASDIWAFGCVVYQFIAGRPPFKESTDYLTMKKIQEGSFSFPEGFDEVVKTLVEGCLVTNPINRTTSGDLRKHEFFSDIDWDTVWTLPPPDLQSGLVAAPEPREEEFKLHWSDLEASEDEMEDFIPKTKSDQSSLKLRMPSMEQNPARQSTPPPSQAVEPRRSIEETPTQSRDFVQNMVYPTSPSESYLKQRRHSQPTEPTKRKVSPVSERTTRNGSPEGLVAKLRRFSSSSDSNARPRRQSPSMDRRGSVNGPLEEDDDSEIGSGEGPPSTLEHNITELVSQTSSPHSRDAESSAGLKSELTQASLASARMSTSETSATSKTSEGSPTSGPTTGFEKVRGAKGLELGEQTGSGEKPWVLANGTKVLAQTESEIYSSPVTIRIKRNLLPPKQRRRVLLLTSSGRLLSLKELKSTTGRKKAQVEDEIIMRGGSSPKMAPTESPSEITATSIPAAHSRSSTSDVNSAPSSSSPSKRSSLLGLSLSGGSSIASTLPNLLLNLPGTSRNHSPAPSTTTSLNGSATHSGPSRLPLVATKVEIIGDVAVTVHTHTLTCTYLAESPMVAKFWVEKLQEAMKDL